MIPDEKSFIAVVFSSFVESFPYASHCYGYPDLSTVAEDSSQHHGDTAACTRRYLPVLYRLNGAYVKSCFRRFAHVMKALTLATKRLEHFPPHDRHCRALAADELPKSFQVQPEYVFSNVC
jgi:hypothetical protein